jgi:LmbE family N-acetylglucosaminyl deacetylase
MAPAPTLVLDVGRFASQKLQALRCHRTQVANGVFDSIDERDAARLLGTEHYRHAPVGARGRTFIDALG